MMNGLYHDGFTMTNKFAARTFVQSMKYEDDFSNEENRVGPL